MSKRAVACRNFAFALKNFNVSKNDTLNFSVSFCHKIYSVATTVWPENEVPPNPDSAPLFVHHNWWLNIDDGDKSKYLMIGISVYRL
jgi:hypothetical protein